MTTDFIAIKGGQELGQLSRDLKASGSKVLQRELRKGMRDCSKVVIKTARKQTGDYLPSGGGLAGVAAKARFTTSSSRPEKATIRISRRQIKGAKLMDLPAMDAGRVRHPLHGNRRRWYGQSVRPGVFSDAIKKSLPELQREMVQVIEKVAAKLAATGGGFGL